MLETFFEKATDKEQAKADSEKLKMIEKLPLEVILELMHIKQFTIYILL